MIAALAAALPAAVTDVPVEPGADEAREWMIGELSKPPYQAAQPTWFDLLSRAIGDWFSSLRVPDGSGLGGLIPLIGVVIVVVVLVVVFLVYGRPRLNRRSRAEIGGLFGTDDTRSAAELRASAARAAAAGDFTVAVEEAFRGLARGLTERTIVTTSPGTTAQDFSRRAGSSFPAALGELADGAALFDGVRYLDRSADRADYDRIVALDRRLQTERPVALEAVPAELVR
ncbi:DUF4129 domain-containing protein [Herbiconiux sp. VKM Ac-1786]|uniref:DUF4129 domain-containing protein n=1 Tax=Herbiconiux sp. VKM Ac-1786 TaxID=2783824 RepID=UPI00188AD561|nr:DUF4129 domain-containing protein [Herbiconiux sp. VKM Ac-1786]MBF4574411.1 DUF4129 domain-containing protein [Herbiconiux sp. VKM Ac-1786]